MLDRSPWLPKILSYLDDSRFSARGSIFFEFFLVSLDRIMYFQGAAL